MTFVNSHLRQRQETERLRNIIARIESYEPVVRRDVYIVSYLGHHIGVLASSSCGSMPRRMFYILLHYL